MVGFTAQELFNRLGGNERKEIREFNPTDNKAYNLWIPEDKFVFVRTHYKLKSCKATPNAKWNGISCILNDPAKKDHKCLVCDYINSLWDKQRNITGSDEKKIKAAKEEIINEIKRIDTRYVYVNAIDMDDPSHTMVVLRLTVPMLISVIPTLKDSPIESIRWHFKRKNSSNKIDYDFFENINDPRALELAKNKDVLLDRTYEQGGRNNIVGAKWFYGNQEQYDAILRGTETVNPDVADLFTDVDELENIEIDTDVVSVEELGVELPDVKEDKQVNKSSDKVELELSDDFDLDSLELDMSTTAKISEPVKAPKVVDRADDLSLDLDKVDLEDDFVELSDDVEELDLVSKITVDHIMVNSKQKDKKFISDVFEALSEAKRITLVSDRTTNLKAAFKELKTNGPIEIIDDSDLPF